MISWPATSLLTVVQQIVSWALDLGGRACAQFLFSPLAAAAMTPETPFLQIQQIQTGRTQTYPNLKEELDISASKLHQDKGGE